MFEYNAVLDRVIDGDTVDATIDLGFDTWKKTRIRDLEEKKRGLAAKDRLIEILKANDNKFVLKSHGVGKYGRCLGELFVETLGETSVQETLINEGHGVAYFGGKR